MKIPQALALLLLAIECSSAQQPPVPGKAQAQVTFHVVTDEGKPVSNVDVTASTFLRWQPGEGFGKDIYQDIKGRTDKDGNTTIIFASQRGDINYGIHDMPGYYSTRNLEYQFKEIKGGKWQPWNPTLELVLKPIINPIPMYGRKIGEDKFLSLPQKGRPIGFDLMAGDWVAPYGKGDVSDLIFELTEKVAFVSAEKPFDVTLTVGFSNKGDGILSVMASPNHGSELLLPRYAPEDGYESTLVKQIGRPAEGKPIHSGSREGQNYFFRVRTVLDEKGKVKSALYGKILGNVVCDVINSKNGFIQFAYCLNPNPNDRNMEFDPKRNLAGHLPFDARVTKP